MQDVPVDKSDIGLAEQGLLIGIQGPADSQYGYLRLQAKRVKQHLESEIGNLDKATS